MKRLFLLASALALSACAGEHHAHIETPPPPPHVVMPKQHVAPHGAVPEHEVRAPQTSAGPLKLAMVGSYMDSQEADFRARLHGAGIRVQRIGDDIILSLRDDILFARDSVSDDGRELLGRVADVLRHYDHTAVQVAGYTDTTGTPDENLSISKARAKDVSDALAADGVQSSRLTSAGFGGTHLKIATGPDVKEPRNRRIEIRIAPRPQA